MNKRQLVTLICVAAVVTAVGIFTNLSHRRTWSRADKGQSGEVLPELPVNDITRIQIASPEGELSLAKRESRWVVTERYGYPADFKKIRDLIRNMAELRATQEIPAGESQYGRLKLKTEGDDEQRGTELAFYTDGEQPTASIILGKPHTGGEEGYSSGRYLMVPGSKRVILVSETFRSAVTDGAGWLDKEFFKIESIKSATLTEKDKTVWEAAREEKDGDMKLLGLKDGQKQKDSDVTSIGNAFSYASFTDVADPEMDPGESGMKKPKTFTANDFNGIVYTIKIGNETGDSKRYMTVSAEYAGPTEREAPQDESDEDREKRDKEFKEELDEKLQKVEALNKRTGGWTYIVNSYTVDKLLKERTDLIEKEEEEEDKEGTSESADE